MKEAERVAAVGVQRSRSVGKAHTVTRKLIGAVTHVLVNDPTTGYGIFIENMLDAAA